MHYSCLRKQGPAVASSTLALTNQVNSLFREQIGENEYLHYIMRYEAIKQGNKTSDRVKEKAQAFKEKFVVRHRYWTTLNY